MGARGPKPSTGTRAVYVPDRMRAVLGKIEPYPEGPDEEVHRLLSGMGWLKPEPKG